MPVMGVSEGDIVLNDVVEEASFEGWIQSCLEEKRVCFVTKRVVWCCWKGRWADGDDGNFLVAALR